MAEWGKVYELKGNASACGIWKCIAGLLQSRTNQEFAFPESSPPHHFFWQDADKSFSWFEDNGWGYFDFAGVLGNAESFLQIIFSKKEKSHGKEKSRLLSCYEKSSGSQFLFLDFLRLMKEKKLVLDKTSPPKKIEHAQKKFESDDNLKILVSDHRDGDLLGRVNDLAEELWFLGANFYTRNEIDYMADLVEKDPVISALKKQMSPKMERQVSSKSNFTELLEGWEGFQEAKQMFHPSVSMMYNGQEKELSFDNMASSADLIPAIISLAFEINKDDFYESQEREFKEFLDKHGKKDLSEIQRQANEQAMNQFLANQSLQQLENQCRDGKTDSSVLVPEQETIAALTQKNEELSQCIRELENRLRDVERQNAHSKADSEGLKKEHDKLEDENKRLLQKINDLQEQLNTKEDADTQRQNKAEEGFVRLAIPCAKEKNLFTNEISDYLLALLYWALGQEKKGLPDNRHKEVSRKRDVIEAVLDGKEFDWNNSKTCRILTDMERVFKDDSSSASAGFTKVSENDHEKYYFKQERYQVTFALTPSDNRTGRGVQNKMKEIRGRLFLMPPSISDSGSSTDS